MYNCWIKHDLDQSPANCQDIRESHMQSHAFSSAILGSIIKLTVSQHSFVDTVLWTMLQYRLPATPDGYGRNLPVLLDKGHRGLGNPYYRKRYLRLKRWWERPPPPRVIMRDAQTQTDDIRLYGDRGYDPAPRAFWDTSDEEGFDAGAITG